MKMNKPLLVVFALCLVLNSCVKTMDHPANKQWLQNLVCSFPCWQNITPQETRFENVVPILQNAKIKVHSITEDEISFLFEEAISGSIKKAPDGTVDNIILDVHDQRLSVGDFMPVIGNPEKLSLTREFYTSDCQAHLLYPASGIILDVAFLENNSKSKNKLNCQVDLSSGSEIFRIVLLSTNLDKSEFWKSSSYSHLDYTEWKGFGRYP